jgi:peptidoglycan/xylan/chitin deacetylase (PgdA/CDA1 family)
LTAPAFELTLAFDNGPEPEVTPQVLDLLGERGLASTFFVMGRKLAEPGARAIAERAHAEGHWIGNHTWSHAAPLGERGEAGVPEAEIGRTQALIGDLSHPDRLFRPNAGGRLGPGVLSPEAVRYLCEGGYTCVLWNAVPRDWVDPDGWVETALAQCRRQAWSALVLHDLPTGAMRHLPRFLDAVIRRGGRIRQDFPPDCMPIVRGEVVGDISGYVSPREPA